MARININDWAQGNNLKKLIEWKKIGLSDEQIAENIGIGVRTLYDWKSKNEIIRKALIKKPTKLNTKPKKYNPPRGRKDTPEFELEQKFKDRVEELGGIAYKLTIKSHNGIPDRMVTFPGGHIGFVEVKRPDGKGYLRPSQKREITLLKQQGQKVFILDKYEQIDTIINLIKQGA